MLSKTLFAVSMMILVLLLSSCRKLKSEHYVGEKEKISNKEFKTESIWQYDEEVFYVRILDSVTVIASYLEWDDSKKEYEVVTFEVVATELGEETFLNIKEPDGLYNILRFVPTADGSIAFFPVDDKKLDKDIEEGRIKVTKNDSDYILDIEKTELDKYVSENINELFKIKTAGLIKPLTKFNKERQ